MNTQRSLNKEHLDFHLSKDVLTSPACCLGTTICPFLTVNAFDCAFNYRFTESIKLVPGVLVLCAIIWYFPITSLQRDWVPVATVLCFPISVLIHQTLSTTNHICDQKYLKAQNFHLTRKILIGPSSLDQSLKQTLWGSVDVISTTSYKTSPSGQVEIKSLSASIKSSEICWGCWVILKKVAISMEERYTFI